MLHIATYGETARMRLFYDCRVYVMFWLHVSARKSKLLELSSSLSFPGRFVESYAGPEIYKHESYFMLMLGFLH